MFKVMTVFGIRPDFIRSSLILKKLAAHPEVELQFVYTGQHYDENLKGVFFKELGIPEPQYNLDTKAGSHAQQHAKLISQLEPVIEEAKPDVVMFLGDANAVIGCITPLKMGIPIAHVEAGMRSHDWRMPEERNRVIIDRVSDVLYAYQHDYKCKLVQEGIDPTKIVVTGNTIVDVLAEYKKEIDEREPLVLFKMRQSRKKYGMMTLHRSEHMNRESAVKILTQVNTWAEEKKMNILLPVMPRLQKIFDKNSDILNTDTLTSLVYTKPLGFFDFVALEQGAAIEFTDSGTNQETSALLGTPCVVTRRSTERPETFDSGITAMTEEYIYSAANYVYGKKLKPGFSLGDGNAADIIVNDLVDRLHNNFYRSGPTTNAFRAQNWKSF
jgi:UDP-N-acetylglucosamine 2-epimerase (non-hydrolysing)